MSVTCSISWSPLDRTVLSLCIHTACPATARSKLWVSPDFIGHTRTQKCIRHNIDYFFPGRLFFADIRYLHTRRWTAWLADQWQLQSTGCFRKLWERTGMPQNHLLIAFLEVTLSSRDNLLSYGTGFWVRRDKTFSGERLFVINL